MGMRLRAEFPFALIRSLTEMGRFRHKCNLHMNFRSGVGFTDAAPVSLNHSSPGHNQGNCA